MKLFNKSLLAAALVIGCTAGAHADTFYVPADSGTAPGIDILTWSFTDIANAGSHIAGKAFDDFFIFNVPDAESISFEVDAVAKGVNFIKSGGGYGVFGYTDGNVIDQQLGTKAHVLTGGTYDLTSGVYVLEVAGQYSTYNGFYAGQITGIPTAVPEPSSVLMLLAGLAGVAGVARMRKSKT